MLAGDLSTNIIGLYNYLIQGLTRDKMCKQRTKWGETVPVDRGGGQKQNKNQ